MVYTFVMVRVTSLATVMVFMWVAACADEAKLPFEPGIGYGGGTGASERPIAEIDGTVGITWDAGPDKPDVPFTPDAPVDASMPDVMRPGDTMMTSDPLECSLLTQTCPGADVCYPFGNGGSKCVTAPPAGGVAGVFCGGHEECAKRHICQDTNCVELCELDLPCANGAACTPLAGYNRVGVCPP